MRFRARAGTIKRMDRPVDQPESPLEILRRLENVARTGTVEEVRLGAPARCRIRCGNILTNWIPWMAGRAGGAAGRVWWPPKVGEQCLMLAPGGDLMNAVALPGAYSDRMPQGSDNPDLFRMDWDGGGYMEHDSAAGTFTLEAMERITLRVMSSIIEITPASIVLEAGGGRLVINGKGATGTPDVFAGPISLRKHVHGGVEPGDGTTGAPL